LTSAASAFSIRDNLSKASRFCFYDDSNVFSHGNPSLVIFYLYSDGLDYSSPDGSFPDIGS
jgi:hypothetical protein